MRKYTFRGILCLCLCLALFAAPLLSEARYRSFLNSFAAVVAKEYYFSSNYLKVGGASYVINGWDGRAIAMDDIDIRNYDNTLLANQAGQDLEYRVEWSVDVFTEANDPISGMPYGLDVTCKESTLSPGEEKREPTITPNAENNGVTGTIVCTIPGDGNGKRDIFALKLKPLTENSELANGSYVRVTLTATNVNERNQYSRTVSCTIRYNVSELENFVRDFSLVDQGKSIETKITTNAIPGAGTVQRIFLWWDTAVLSVNRFNHQFNQLYLEGKYKEVTVNEGTADERTFGLVELSASSLSSRTFQFDELKPVEFSLEKDKNFHVLFGVNYDDESVKADDYLGYYVETSAGS